MNFGLLLAMKRGLNNIVLRGGGGEAANRRQKL